VELIQSNIHHIVTATPDWIIHTRALKIQRNEERRRLAAIKQEISKYHCITREPEALLNLYSRELSSTIDRLQNGKIAYIYPKPITTTKPRLIIKNITSACLLADCTCSLWMVMCLCQMQPGSWQPCKRIDLSQVPFRTFHLWWRRCLTTTNHLNNCFLGIGNDPTNSAFLERGILLALPPRSAERPNG
jgi:hypothetical protein